MKRNGKSLKEARILFAPHEIGGQMQLMVEELRRRGYYATSATYSQEWFGHVNDVHLNVGTRGGLRKHLRLLLFTFWAASQYDIFHFFWGSSLYGIRRFPHLDLPWLRRLGKKIFVHFRGLDLVDLAYFDYLRSCSAGKNVLEPQMSRPDQLRSLALWRKHAHRLLVSEPDLLQVAPDAVMVQQAIDTDYWQVSNQPTAGATDGIIRVAHAPSLRRKKGTEFVEQSVGELKAEGLPVELVLIEKVPFHEVKDLYLKCDVGVDQVLYGWYGKVSIELMALGRPVVCYIDPRWLQCRGDMPIVSARPVELTQKLRELVLSANLRHDLGGAGRAYVEKYHDVKAIIDQCLELYQESML